MCRPKWPKKRSRPDRQPGRVNDSLLLRQVALVSYGTQFLRGLLPLEQWYQHGIFFDARLQFRDGADQRLLAADFTLWLTMLRATGAQRLSLHQPSELAVTTPAAERGGDYIVVAHFPDRYQLWVTGTETAGWREPAELQAQATSKYTYPYFPDAATYAARLDSYWCIKDVDGALALPETDWGKLTTTIRGDLAIRIASGTQPGVPFNVRVPSDRAWSQFPLFIFNNGLSQPHRLMTALDLAKSKYDNDTHCKNEGNLYNFLDEQGSAELYAWSQRLDQWIIDVLLRCANENRSTGKFKVAPTAPEPTKAEATADNLAATPSAAIVAPPAPTNVADEAPLGKWGRRMAFAFLLAAITAGLLAFGMLIARYPWSALLIALPFAYYLHQKKD